MEVNNQNSKMSNVQSNTSIDLNKESEKMLPNLQEVDAKIEVEIKIQNNVRKRQQTFRRMPTKTELLLEKSNFHRIRNYEQMRKLKEDLEEKNKQKVIIPTASNVQMNENNEEDLSP